MTVSEPRVEHEVGEGLDDFLSEAEAKAALAAIAKAVLLEDWAGPVATAAELEATHGIERSTLYRWTREGRVIALSREGRRVYPLAQLSGQRPAPGLNRVRKHIPHPKVAWLWLWSVHPSLDARPIDLLKAGVIEPVLTAADEDYGQQI